MKQQHNSKTNVSALEEKAIKTANRIRRALEIISPNISYTVKSVESSYSFFGPKFCIEGIADYEIDFLLEEQFGLFVRKFLNYRSFNFHDIRVTWCKGHFSVYHAPAFFECGYFRIDYIASDEIPESDYRPEGQYYLLNRGEESGLVRIADFAGVHHKRGTASVLELNRIEDPNAPPRVSDKLFASSDELIDLSGHYFIKDTIISLIKCDKASAARNLYRDAIQKGIYLPPFLVTSREEEFQKAVDFIDTKFPVRNSEIPKGNAKVYPIFMVEPIEKVCHGEVGQDKCCDGSDDDGESSFDWNEALKTTSDAKTKQDFTVDGGSSSD